MRRILLALVCLTATLCYYIDASQAAQLQIVDEPVPSNLHNDLTGPPALDTNGGIGPIEVLQTSPTGGILSAADVASTITTTTSQGGAPVITGTPTTGSAVTFTFPNSEGTVSFSIFNMTALVTGGAIFSECSPDQANWTPCPVSLPGQSDTFSVTGNVFGGKVSVAGYRYWRLRNTGTLTGSTITVTATLTPIVGLNQQTQVGAQPTVQPVAWTTATTVNTTALITLGNTGAQSASVVFDGAACTTPTGVIQIQIDYGDGNWINIANTQVRTPAGIAGANPYAQLGSTNTQQIINLLGASRMQFLLSTALGGTGTCSVTIYTTLFNYPLLPPSTGAVSANSFPNQLTYTQSWQSSQYPTSSGQAPTPSIASATGTTAATVATLAAGGAGLFTFLCGIDIAADATAATEGNATIVSNAVTLMTIRQSVAALANGTAHTTLTFTPCIEGNATNKSIVITSAAAGSGGNTTVNAWGYVNKQ